jgi:hypothetical protein
MDMHAPTAEPASWSSALTRSRVATPRGSHRDRATRVSSDFIVVDPAAIDGQHSASYYPTTFCGSRTVSVR